MIERESEQAKGALEAVLELGPEERRPAALLALAGVALGFAVIAARTARDALFLTTVGASGLPHAYLWSALAIALGVAIAVRVARRTRPEVVYPIVAALLGSLAFGARLSIDVPEVGSRPWFAPALYVAVEAGSAMGLALFWSLVEAFLADRVESRLFQRVETASIALAIVCAVWALGLLELVPVDDLLLFAAGFLWLSTIPAVLLAGTARRPSSKSHRPSPLSGLLVSFSPDLGLAATAAALGAIAGTIIDWQLKATLTDAFPGDREAIAHGLVWIVVLSGIAWIAIRRGSRLTQQRLGVTSVLIVAAIATAVGEGLMLLAPIVWAAAVARGAQQSLSLSSSGATLQRVLKPVPRRLRGHWAALVDEVLRPGGIALGAVLLGGVGLVHKSVAYVALAAVAVLLLVLRSLAVEHARSVGLSRRRWLEPADVWKKLFGARSSTGSLESGLRSKNPTDVLNALEFAELDPVDLSAFVAPHLADHDPRVRLRACEYIGKKRHPAFADFVKARLNDPDTQVRATVIRVFCELKGAAAGRLVAPFLDHEDPALAAAAAIGLASSAGKEGASAARTAILRLARDPDPAARVKAAEAIAALADRSYTSLTIELLDDDDGRVRRAAAAAAGAIRSDELLRPLLAALARRDTARAAETALAGYGTAALDSSLRLHCSTKDVASGIVRVLGRLGTPDAIRVLIDALTLDSGATRGAVCRALARALRENPREPVEHARIAAACRLEVASAVRVLAIAEAFGLPDMPRAGGSGLLAPEGAHASTSLAGTDVIRNAEKDAQRADSLLAWALDEDFERAVERLFFLLAALHPHVIAAPPDLASRAAVVDALANLIEPPLARLLLRLFAGVPRDNKLRASAGVLKPPLHTLDVWLLDLLGDEDAWVVTAATYWAGANRVEAAKSLVVALLERGHPVVRETALEALEKIEPIDQLPRAVQPLLWDDSAPIQRRVDRVLERIVDAAELRAAHGKIERVFA